MTIKYMEKFDHQIISPQTLKYAKNETSPQICYQADHILVVITYEFTQPALKLTKTLGLE